MVTRSKAAWAAKKKRVSDTTYHGIINFHEGMEERLHQTLEHYGQLKAVDLSRAQAHYNEHKTLPTREERVLPIREQKVSSDIARAIVEHNTTLIENTVEAAEKTLGSGPLNVIRLLRVESTSISVRLIGLRGYLFAWDRRFSSSARRRMLQAL